MELQRDRGGASPHPRTCSESDHDPHIHSNNCQELHVKHKNTSYLLDGTSKAAHHQIEATLDLVKNSNSSSPSPWEAEKGKGIIETQETGKEELPHNHWQPTIQSSSPHLHHPSLTFLLPFSRSITPLLLVDHAAAVI
jgi:hypothetical protein